jgi:O-antigen/teichoic acid export membrane protein
MRGPDAPLDKAISIVRDVIARGILRTGSYAFVDQSVVAAANFVTMIIAARVLGPAAFGVYALLFTILALMDAIQASLVSSPYTVLSASKTGVEAYQRYTSSVVAIQFMLALAAAGIMLLAAGVAYSVGSSIWTMLVAVSFASIGWQLHGFVRVILFAQSRFGAALVDDIVAHGLRLAIVGALLLGPGLTVEGLFIALGVACLIGATLGLWQIRASLARVFDLEVVSEHWRFGSWVCASRVVSEVPKYVTAALLSATLSIGAYGAYRAGNQLVHGAKVPMAAFANIWRPWFARKANHGAHSVFRAMAPVLVVGGLGLTAVAVGVIILREPLLSIIYGSEYGPYAAVMVLIAFKPVTSLFKEVMTDGMLALRETRTIFTRTMIGTLTGTILGGISILIFGLPAAAAISLFGSVAAIVWLARAWKARLEREGEDSWLSAPTSIPEQSSSRRTGNV